MICCEITFFFPFQSRSEVFSLLFPHNVTCTLVTSVHQSLRWAPRTQLPHCQTLAMLSVFLTLVWTQRPWGVHPTSKQMVQKKIHGQNQAARPKAGTIAQSNPGCAATNLREPNWSHPEPEKRCCFRARLLWLKSLTVLNFVDPKQDRNLLEKVSVIIVWCKWFTTIILLSPWQPMHQIARPEPAVLLWTQTSEQTLLLWPRVLHKSTAIWLDSGSEVWAALALLCKEVTRSHLRDDQLQTRGF